MSVEDDSAVTGGVETPAVVTYREMVDQHADRVYALAAFLLGDRVVAQSATLEAFQRLWKALEAGQIIGDAEENLYRFVTRGALQRMTRSSELRGYQPATTVDDRQVTAAGIVDGFSPQQRAAIFAVAWARLGYRTAGLASGVGEARARDLLFAARQEYSEARGSAAAANPACREIAPLLSARADGELSPQDAARVDAHLSAAPVCQQTADLYEEFGAMLRAMRLPRAPAEPTAAALAQLDAALARSRPRPLQSLLRLASGPAILVVVLIVGLFLFGPCGEASVRTGVGRTSDLLYAREAGSGALVVLESGSGRELSRLPAGVLSPDGGRVYSTTTDCPNGSCGTIIRATDTATRESADVGRVEGRLAPLAVGPSGDAIYLTEQDSPADRLVGFDLPQRRVGSVLPAPSGVDDAFRPRGAAHAGSGRLLFTLGAVDGQGHQALVRTDLEPLAATWTELPFRGSEEVSVGAPSSPGPGSVFIYDFGGGGLYEVDPDRRAVLRSAQLGGAGGPAGAPDPALALAPDGKTLYAVLAGGGIGVVDLQAQSLAVGRRYTPDRTYSALALSSDGRLLFALSGSSYLVLDAASGEQRVRRDGARVGAFVQVNPGE